MELVQTLLPCWETCVEKPSWVYTYLEGIEFFPSNVRLRQGCNMSPLLFNLFVNNINETFDVHFRHPVSLRNIKLSNLLYADDLILTSETKTGQQSCLDNLQAYCQKWKLMVNNKKTKVMVAEKRQFSAQIHYFSFQKEPLEICIPTISIPGNHYNKQWEFQSKHWGALQEW